MNFRNKKYKIFFMLFLLMVLGGILVFDRDVFAADTVTVGFDDKQTVICADGNTGEYVKEYYDYNHRACGSYIPVDIKTIGDDYAHCVNWGLYIGNRSNYSIDTSWKPDSKNAIRAGYLMHYVNSQEFSSFSKKYLKIGEALNTFFVKEASGYNYGSKDYSSDTYVKGYMEKVDAYYATVKRTNKLPSLSFGDSSNSMKYNSSSKKYFSNKITVSGLVANYGGDNDKTEYTIRATASNNATIKLCTKSNGTDCKDNSITLNAPTATSYSFYLFVDEGTITPDDAITIKVSGSNKSTYYSSVLYKEEGNSSAQNLLVESKYTYPRTVSKSMSLTIPDLVNHKIVVYKVDENGDFLGNAVLELYKDNSNDSKNLLKSNTDKGYRLSYTSPKSTESADDFFNHDYYLVEKSAPDGYVLNSTPKKIYSKGSSNSDGLSCYKSLEGNMELVDDEFCNFENYDYKCKNSVGDLKDPDANLSCDYLNVIPDDDPITDGNQNGGNPNDGTVPDDSSDEGDNGAFGEDTNTNPDDTPSVPVDPYNKVCYKKNTKTVVDDEYCSNKGNYTKIESANGNITVEQINTKNLVRISKTDITGDKEVAGATLKICTKANYESQKESCSVAKNIDGVDMSWKSSDTAHSIYGIPVGSYYIIEEIPPIGYIKETTATPFSIDDKGKVVSGDITISNEELVNESKAIIIKNKLTKISISKQDLATSKELAGAKISICKTYKDEDGKLKMLVDLNTGDCIEAILANGFIASWVSTDKPKEIVGLDAGTYYLVEKIAPAGYELSESIMFTLKNDGTLVDKDGKSLKNNKLVMYDKVIEEVKTGSLSTYIVIGLLVVGVATGIGCYIYFKKKR